MFIFSPVQYVLNFHINTLRSLYAVPNMTVLWISLNSCFPGMLLRYCMSDIEMFPVVPLIAGYYYICYYDEGRGSLLDKDK